MAVDLKDRGPIFLFVQAIFADVAVGTNRNVELGAILAGDQVLRPMVIDGTGRQVGDLLSWRIDVGRTFCVSKANDRIGIGDVKIIADKSHSEGRVQLLEEG